MNTILLVLLVIILVWIIILQLDQIYDLESFGAEVSPGMLLWRTRRGVGLLDRIANISKKGWKIFGFVGVGIGIVLMGSIFTTLATNLVPIISSIWATGDGGGSIRAMPIVPGITIPLLSGLIALISVILVHESAHGITARRAGISIKSAGLGLFTFLPLAFVEPDEDEMEKASLLDKLQVFGAGSFANILFGFLCLAVLLAFVVPLPGVYTLAVGENTPAENKLQVGMRLTSIGYIGSQTNEIYESSDLSNFMDNTKLGENIIIRTDNGSFHITLDNHEEENKGYIGIYTDQSEPRRKIAGNIATSLFLFWKSPSLGGGINHYSYDFQVPESLLVILLLIFGLNLGVGLFNLLPALPLDGGRMLFASIKKVCSHRRARYISLSVSVITFSIVIINLIPWLTLVL